MDREAFLQAMIAELEQQKREYNNSDRFFTGTKRTSDEIFRKLCFDFPAVDDEDILILQNDVKSLLLPNLSLSASSLKRTFSLNEPFLENIIRLSSNPVSISIDESDSLISPSATVTQSRNAMRSLALVIFFSFPVWLLTRSKEQLCQLFAEDTYSIINNLPPAIENAMSWSDILSKFRAIILRSSITLVQGMSKDDLLEGNCLNGILECIKLLIAILGTTSEASASSLEAGTLGQYISEAVDSNDSDEAYDAVACGREILTHLIHLYLDILSLHPSVVSDCFPSIFHSLYEPVTNRVAFSPVQSNFPTLGEYIGMKALGNFASSLIQTLDVRGKATVTLATIESIRKFLLSEQNLSRLITVAENVKTLNLASSSTSSSPDAILDIETSVFFIEIMDLLVYKDINSAMSSSVQRSFFDKLTSSRLLICLLNVFHQIVSIQHTMLTTSSNEKLKNWTKLWQMSCRLNSVATRLMTISSEARLFLLQSSALQHIWQATIDLLLSKSLQSTSAMIWSPSLGYSILYSAIYTGRVPIPGSAQPAGLDQWINILQSTSNLTARVSSDLFQPMPNIVATESASADVVQLNESGSQEEEEEISNSDKTLFLLQRQWLESFQCQYMSLSTDNMKDTIRMTISMKVPSAITFKEFTAVLLRDLARFRIQLISSSVNPNLQAVERVIRVVKDVGSVLEGGISSKSD